jgi:hypothetical protein
MMAAGTTWRERERARTLTLFRAAWDGAPAGGRQALLAAAARDRVGHHWTSGRGACVLALLVQPALRPRESPKAAAYRFFGCEVTDNLPATWDADGVTLAELLESVGAALPAQPNRGGAAGAWRALAGGVQRLATRPSI